MIKRPHPIRPATGHESVWDYPRPPRIDPTTGLIQVRFNDIIIAETRRAIRVLETSHPPGYYIAKDDIQMQFLQVVPGRETFCEFKGSATYWNIHVGDRTAAEAGWSYENPAHGFEAIRGYISIYPGRVDACTVNGEIVEAQAGNFYGGWITSDIVGPFKGDPGTWGW